PARRGFLAGRGSWSAGFVPGRQGSFLSGGGYRAPRWSGGTLGPMLMTLPRRARMALAGAAIGVVLIALTWYLSHYVAFLRRVDVSILLGFAQLNRPRLDRLTNFIASLCDPQWYVFLAVIPRSEEH